MTFVLVTLLATLVAFVLGVVKASRVDTELANYTLISGLILLACWLFVGVLDDMWLGDVTFLLALVLIGIGGGVTVGNRKRS